MNYLIKMLNGPYLKVSMNICIDLSRLYTKSAKKHLSNRLMSLPHLK